MEKGPQSFEALREIISPDEVKFLMIACAHQIKMGLISHPDEFISKGYALVLLHGLRGEMAMPEADFNWYAMEKGVRSGSYDIVTADEINTDLITQEINEMVTDSHVLDA